MFLSKRVVGHMALGVGGPGSIPPWRALSKSLTFPSKSMINANIRPSELQKVTFGASGESLVRGLAQGPYFWCIGSPSGRPGCRAGVAQWLGTRLVGGRWEGPGSIPPSRAFMKTLQISTFGRQNHPKVTIWASDESLVRGLAQGPYSGA